MVTTAERPRTRSPTARSSRIGIVALSLVPLVGYAGQISLAPAQLRRHRRRRRWPTTGPAASPLGLVLGRRSSPPPSAALVALPVLRLSGIYLALATAAFAVALDRWIFNLPDFDLGPSHISLFELGSAAVDPLELFGYDVRQPRVAAHARRRSPSSLVAMLVVRDPPQRLRPAAARDARQRGGLRHPRAEPARHPARRCSRCRPASPGSAARSTACSSASISPERFDLVTGLPIFMLVGGRRGRARRRRALRRRSPSTGSSRSRRPSARRVEKLDTVSPGLTGIGLGRNPSGAVPARCARRWRRCARTGRVLLAMLGAMVVVVRAAAAPT